MDDPVSISSIKGIIMLFVASGIGVGGKIIFDYFRLTRMPGNNRNGGAAIFKNFKNMCDQKHQGIDKSFEVIDSKLDKIDSTVIKGSLKVKAIESDVKEHEKRLEKGIAKFEGIRTDLVEIKSNIAVLLDRARQRRKTDFTGGAENES